ncbi:hypothetical protein ABH922_005510 [Rhodococcus sp. 27YEA15]|uniref:FAS1-like dehydratase domain-containing protein n=1 Tax=Rhodococcus sp. 27YEA15 TaxID=3156259 RepID=UPI003C79C668
MDHSAVVIGKTGQDFVLPIERGKLREFVGAVAERSIDTDDPAAVIPPTFLATAMWWQGDDANPLHDAELDSARMLHVEVEYVFPSGAPQVGTTLTGTARISDTWEKEGKRAGPMTFVAVTTDYRNEKGDMVAQCIWTEAHISRPASAR